MPRDSGPAPSATAAALPPLEPPAVRERSYGLRVTPDSGESVTPFQPNSGVVVLPTNTAPCSRSRATDGASSSHGPSARTVREPRSVGPPRISRMSFTDTGTPSTSPAAHPAASAPPTRRRLREGVVRVEPHEGVDRGLHLLGAVQDGPRGTRRG